jgi:UPF0755 protein
LNSGKFKSEDPKNSVKINRGSKVKVIIMKSFLILILVMPLIVVMLVDYFRVPDLNDKSEKVPFIISKGASIDTIADSLFAHHLIKDKELFILWLTTLDKDRLIKAGYYEIPMGLNYAQLISFLSKAPPKEMKVTLIEGWRLEEIAEELQEKLNIDKEKFLFLANDSLFISKMGIEATNLEGYLLPDTYHFYWGVDEQTVLKFLVNQCLTIFNTEVKDQIAKQKMSIHQIITLASIIEGEAIFDEEREIISSVYHNRLNRRIKLQADPTIQYILDGPPRRLLFKDLEIDSPYNTYKYYGLPPGPISNPGKNSILAAIYPETTKYIYFVAKGDGKHVFSTNGADHQRAKAQFDRVRREVKRQKRLSKTKRDTQ